MTRIWRSNAERKDFLSMVQMRSCHLSDMNDMQIKFGSAPVSKTLIDGRNMFDVIPNDMWTS